MVTLYTNGDQVCMLFVYCLKNNNNFAHVGQKEDIPDKLRAILAQFEFSQAIKAWDAKGIPFSSYLYVPERHPILNTEFHEREDEGHVFKVKFCTHIQTFVGQ